MDQKKTYKVLIDETVMYSINIEAKDSEEASHIAMDIWGSNGPDSFKLEDVADWNITDVTEIKQQKEVA